MLAPPRCASLPKGRAVGFSIQILVCNRSLHFQPKVHSFYTPRRREAGTSQVIHLTGSRRGLSEPPQVRGGLREPGFAGATPQDLLRFLPRNPKGVLLRYGEANGVVERVEPEKPTAGGSEDGQEVEQEASASPSTTLFGAPLKSSLKGLPFPSPFGRGNEVASIF